MFFTMQLLQETVVQTNNYARQFHLNHMVLSPHSRARKCKDLTPAELKGFIACKRKSYRRILQGTPTKY